MPSGEHDSKFPLLTASWSPIKKTPLRNFKEMLALQSYRLCFIKMLKLCSVRGNIIIAQKLKKKQQKKTLGHPAFHVPIQRFSPLIFSITRLVKNSLRIILLYIQQPCLSYVCMIHSSNSQTGPASAECAFVGPCYVSYVMKLLHPPFNVEFL